MNISKNGLKVRYFMPPHLALRRWRSTLLAICWVITPTLSWLVPSARWKRSKRFTVLKFTIPIQWLESLSTKLEAPRLFTYSNCVWPWRTPFGYRAGKFVEEQFIKPYQAILEQWSAVTLLINQHIGHLLWKSYYRLQLLAAYKTVLAFRTWKALVAVETRKRRLNWR